MSLPVATTPTQGKVVIATGDATAFWTAIATILTLPSGFTGPDNVRSMIMSQNADGSVNISLSFTS